MPYKNKQDLKENKKRYYEKNKERILEESREYYKKNKEKVKQKVLDYQRKTNYAYEKNTKRRIRNNLRRKSSHYFPMDGQLCEHCNEKATERHHTTEPMQYDKFKFLCKDCHVKEHKTKEVIIA